MGIEVWKAVTIQESFEETSSTKSWVVLVDGVSLPTPRLKDDFAILADLRDCPVFVYLVLVLFSLGLRGDSGGTWTGMVGALDDAEDNRVADLQRGFAHRH